MQKRCVLLSLLLLTTSYNFGVLVNLEKIEKESLVVRKELINRGYIFISQKLQFQEDFQNDGTVKAEHIIAEKNFTGKGFCTTRTMEIGNNCIAFRSGALNVTEKLSLANPKTKIDFSAAEAIIIGALYKKNVYMGNIESRSSTSEIIVTDYNTLSENGTPIITSHRFKGSMTNLYEALSIGITAAQSHKEFVDYLKKKIDPKNNTESDPLLHVTFAEFFDL